MNKSFAYVNLAIVSIAAVLLGLLFIFSIPDGNVITTMHSVNDNWYYNGGASGNVRQDEAADPENPVFDSANTISMYRKIDWSTFNGADLCFTTNNLISRSIWMMSSSMTSSRSSSAFTENTTANTFTS